MTAITLTATQLRDLVTPVMPHASNDRTVPILEAVHLRSSGQYVTAIATDRYRIAFQRTALDLAPEPGFDAVVSTPVLKRILAIFKPTRWHDPLLTLTAADGRLTVGPSDTIDQTPGAAGDLVGGSLTFQLVDGDYPKVDRLVRTALEAEPDAALRAPFFNPEFLAAFRIGQPRHIPMQISATGDVNKPWLIRIGEDFIGLLVPVRLAAGMTSEAASWLPLLDEHAEETKAA